MATYEGTPPENVTVQAGYYYQPNPNTTTEAGTLATAGHASYVVFWDFFWITGWISRIIVALIILVVIVLILVILIMRLVRLIKTGRWNAHPSRLQKQLQYYACCGCVTSAIGVETPCVPAGFLDPEMTLVVTFLEASGLPKSCPEQIVMDCTSDEGLDKPKDPGRYQPTRPHSTIVAPGPTLKDPATRKCNMAKDQIQLDWHGDENFVLIRLKQWVLTRSLKDLPVLGEVRIPAASVKKYCEEAKQKPEDLGAGSRRLHLIDPLKQQEMIELDYGTADIDGPTFEDQIAEKVKAALTKPLTKKVEAELQRLKEENEKLVSENQQLGDGNQPPWEQRRKQDLKTKLMTEGDMGRITVRFQLVKYGQESPEADNYSVASFKDDDVVTQTVMGV